MIFPDITYSFYDVWAELLRIPFRQIPLDGHFSIRTEDYKVPNGGVVIANPNAPTGKLLEIEKIEEIIASNQDSIVIIDEAYIDFGGVSALPLLDKYDNLLVVQTFSKSRALAGMRIGAAFGSRYLIQCLNAVKHSVNSYTMNTISLKMGAAAVRDRAWFRETTDRIIRTREQAKQELRRLGFSFEDSCSNFLFVTHERVPAAKLFADLKKAGIYVRFFNQPRISNYLRITIGTDEEMERLYKFLEDYLKND